MAALAVFLDLKSCSVIFVLLFFPRVFEIDANGIGTTESLERWDKNVDEKAKKRLVATGTDIIKSTYRLIESLEPLRQKNMNRAPFEIGYLMFTTFEKYRKMVDKYNTSRTLNNMLWTMELVIYLEDIEHHYWELEHIAPVQNLKELKTVFNDSIYNELSWSVKLLLIKDYLNSAPKDAPPPTVVTSRPDPEPEPFRRMPRMEALVIDRRQEPATPGGQNEDDNSMRLKLFRLMYETIRDSDLKCKRAELIRSHYENSSTFEIGYLMGDVMDKYNIMSDISMTLTRLFHEWKPIEHINAYEQISNQAIEINHLIDMMKGINKKNDTGTDNT